MSTSLLRAHTPPDRGALFVVTGPSGVGKSTLIRHAMERIPGIRFSVSATTRAPRTGERDAVDYHFLTHARFDELLGREAFLEHAVVYDNKYGTLRAPIDSARDAGDSILLDVDVQGARLVKERQPDAVLVYVLPPSVASLETRLRGRATDSEAVIARRMEKAGEQLLGCPEYDYIVVNDDLETARVTFEAVILGELSRRERRGSIVKRIVEEVKAR